MSTLMMIAFTLCIYLASSAPCTPGCEARRPLLVELNGATNGRNWHRPWNISATSVCDFGRGITCTNDDIDELYLYDNNLDGTLPESLASLTALQKFGMPYNNLRGTIPKVWKSLAKLNLFDFMSNALVGPLPDDFGAGWPLMNSFSITNNFINGTLPESYAQWQNLTFFAIGNNSIKGTLPKVYGSAWKESILHVQLHTNRFEGALPEEFGMWRSIQVFGCEGNRLSGTLPASYASWSAIQNVSVQNNSLTGTLPPEYKSWTGLVLLSFAQNAFTGTLPAAYKTWTNVSSIAIVRNKLTGTLPAEWGSTMKNMAQLAVGENLFHGQLPSAWEGMTSLRLLMASNCSLQGSLPASWSSMPRMAQMFLDINFISGGLPPSWSTMPNLVTLTLSSNALLGTVPKEWGSMRLNFLLLQGNRGLTGTLPSSWNSIFSNFAFVPIAFFSICGTSLCSPASSRFPGLWQSQFTCMPPGVAPSVGAASQESVIAEFLPHARFQTSYCFTPTHTLEAPDVPLPTPAAPKSNGKLAMNGGVSSASGTAAGVLLWAGLLTTAIPRAALMGGVIVGGVQGVQVTQRARLRCLMLENDAMSSTNDPLPDLGQSVWDNPLQFPIMSLRDPYVYAGGALIGNTAILLIVSVALHFWAMRLRPRLVKEASQPPPSPSLSLRQRASAWIVLHTEGELLPGAAAAPYAILVQPSIMCSWALLTSPMLDAADDERGDASGTIIFGVCGIVAWSAPVMWWTWQLMGPLRPFPFRCDPVELQQPPTTRNRAKIISALSRFQQFVEPQMRWRHALVQRNDAWAVVVGQTCRSLFTPYGARRHWFYTVEMSVVMALGTIAGVVASVPSSAACVAADACTWSMVVVCLGLVVAHVLLHPCASGLDHVVSVSNSILVLIALVCAAVEATDASAAFSVLASVEGIVVLFAVAGLTACLGWRRGTQPILPYNNVGSSATSSTVKVLSTLPLIVGGSRPSKHDSHASRNSEAIAINAKQLNSLSSNPREALAQLVKLACQQKSK